ncbi:maleylpyruvate isomerase N-terminal domain-containing protein [Sphaerimonospora sp. CA-214678]|uniref:maleylpyruvate isomerase N-terminal domain-containing protein n=1 Tax=Sphaerimonospora sp. CA-214678 TaxID=3240029 RepID=UPI003D8ECA2E
MWKSIDAQRRSLVDLLEDLSEAEWRRPSLCAGWTVRGAPAGRFRAVPGPDVPGPARVSDSPPGRRSPFSRRRIMARPCGRARRFPPAFILCRPAFTEVIAVCHTGLPKFTEKSRSPG